jgi:iron complex outermembrane recepter protein
MSNHSRFLARSVALLLAMAAAHAQQAADTPATEGLEEVIVTAQKRAENAQSVPIAITAISAESLESKGLSTVTEIADFAPNVQMDNTSPFAGSSQVLSAFIRGIGQNDFAFNLEPGVGLYVDGVYYARTLGAVVDLLDLDHVEVLKGPQGTLFGRNTIGGAISVVTRDPINEFAYKAEVTAGSFHRLDVRGSIDIPLIDGVLLSSLAFSSKDREGHQRLIPFPGASQFQTDLGRFRTANNQQGSDRRGGTNTQNVRGKLLWDISDDVVLRFSADLTHTDEDSTPQTLVATNVDPASGTVASLYNACISLPTGVLAMLQLTGACGPRGTVGTPLASANADADPFNDRLPYGNQYITGDIDTSFAKGSNYSKLDAFGLSATLDWALGEAVNLKSITAYRDSEANFGSDLGGAPFVVADLSFTQNQDQFSQELQLTGTAFDDRFKWLVGAYYFQEDGDLTDYVPFLEGLVQVFGPNFFDNRAAGAFTHLNFKVTDWFSVTAGLRYTDEHKEFEGRQQDLNSLPAKTGFPIPLHPIPTDTTRLYPLGVNTKDFTDTSPKVGVEFQPSQDILVYASYSEGFKSGGWTTRLLVPETAVVNGMTVPGPAPDFDPETATAYEVGLKSRLFDNRARLNVAVFDTRYDDIQVTVQRGISPTFENAGDGKITGAEVELAALLGDDLEIGVGLGYLDARYTSLQVGSLVEKSDKFVNTPEFAGSVTADYHLNLTGGAALLFHGDWAHRDDVANDAVNNAVLNQDAIDLFNASVGYTSSDGRWELLLGGRNLSDKRYIVSGFQNDGIGISSAVYSRPREWYLTLRIK